MPAPTVPSEAGPARPPMARRIDRLSLGWLYFLTLTVLGALVISVVWERPDLTRREKFCIIAFGCLQTLAALVVLVLFFIWILGWMKSQLSAPIHKFV